MQKQLKEEISKLEEQKANLIKEIDQLEAKLIVTQEIAVKGDITLQCGTQIRIEPQFHLKLNPQARLDAVSIVAILEFNQSMDFRDIRGDQFIQLARGERLGFWGNTRAIQLWERKSVYSLD